VFGPQIGWKSLSLVCRQMATLLDSGVTVRQTFKLAAGKTGDSRCRKTMAAVSEAIDAGEDVATAMRDQAGAFPELLIDMVDVAEQSGAMPEILIGLADHYENNLRMRTNFLRQIAWPVFQLVAAILVIALLLVLLGWVADAKGGEPIDVLGLGLSGTLGAVTWLIASFGSIFGVLIAFQVASSSMSGRKFLHPLLLRLPVIGNCMLSFAIARFSWAFYLTQQTGMPIRRSLEASLKATTNGAFIAATPGICELVKAGQPLYDALAASNLFPADFLQMVQVGETSGTVPEQLHRLSPQFEDQARRSLSTLTAVFGWSIWLAVAMMIVFFIFRIFTWYIGLINEFSQ
jgi:type IV pilus assembly protein PilC